MFFLTELFMEKNFTLMKTLTAFLNLLLFRSKKNSRPVNNDQASTTESGTGTTVTNHLKYSNDAKQCDASFLFFNESTVDGQQSEVDRPQSMDNDQKLKRNDSGSNSESKEINDELALGSSPTPVYKSWKERVNDDLAACSPVVSHESVVASRESVNVINDVVKNMFQTSATILTMETRTNKNDAFLPFASFCFLFADSFAKGDLCQNIGQLFYNVAEALKNRRPVLLTIPIRSKQAGKPNYNDRIKL